MKQKININLTRVAAEKCADYLLDSEIDDFVENPSRDHIYFWAYLLAWGQDAAEKMLDNFLRGVSK